MGRAREDRSALARSQRIFRVGDDWYLQTRERVDVGPFSSHAAALDAVHELTHRLLDSEPWDRRKALREIARIHPSIDRAQNDSHTQPARAAGVKAVWRAGSRHMKQTLRNTHRGLVLSQSIRRLQRRIASGRPVETQLIERLRYGWGNEGWSASSEFIHACIDEARRCNGAILECGTGLTTLVLGIVAAERQIQVVSLEHSEEWCKRVRALVSWLGVTNVSIEHRPLRDYGDFTWYEHSADERTRFAFVVCDGPPGDTPGGRYGLLPVASHSLTPDCVILLDDAVRAPEQRIARRWATEARLHCELCGVQTPFFRLSRICDDAERGRHAPPHP